ACQCAAARRASGSVSGRRRRGCVAAGRTAPAAPGRSNWSRSSRSGVAIACPRQFCARTPHATPRFSPAGCSPSSPKPRQCAPSVSRGEACGAARRRRQPTIDSTAQFWHTRSMKQTLLVKLAPSPEDHAALLHTLEVFNTACNAKADVAYEHRQANKIELQKLVYYTIRERFGLSSQMVIRAIAKVSEAHKREMKVKPTFRLNGTRNSDQRNCGVATPDRVSLLTLDGRVVTPSRFGVYADGMFIAYKAALAGVPVVYVNPASTSQTCSRCRHCEMANRTSQSKFLCRSCGFSAH